MTLPRQFARDRAGLVLGGHYVGRQQSRKERAELAAPPDNNSMQRTALRAAADAER